MESARGARRAEPTGLSCARSRCAAYGHVVRVSRGRLMSSEPINWAQLQHRQSGVQMRFRLPVTGPVHACQVCRGRHGSVPLSYHSLWELLRVYLELTSLSSAVRSTAEHLRPRRACGA